MIRQDCYIEVREDLDQQLVRLMNCGEGGNAILPITYDVKDPTLYELPKTTFPVNAPLDSTAIEPGVRPTVQPAPAQVPVTTQVTDPAPQKSGVVEWVKGNPLIAGAAAALTIYFLSRRKKR